MNIEILGAPDEPTNTVYKRVLKYTLHDLGPAIVPLPQGSRVLNFIDQGGAIQMYAEVRTDQPILEKRTFVVCYTGHHAVPLGAEYLGTVASNGGNIVRHIYELRTI